MFTKEQAIQFIGALNQVAMYVPPVNMQTLEKTVVVQEILKVANDTKEKTK